MEKRSLLSKRTSSPSATCTNAAVAAGTRKEEDCEGWIKKNRCEESWAKKDCAKSCGTCVSCALQDWGDWSTCSSSCAGGGQTRSRHCTTDAGETVSDYAVESAQCNTDACSPSSCSLNELAVDQRISITNNVLDGAAINGVTCTDVQGVPTCTVENLKLTIETGQAPAIGIYNSDGVTLKNIEITHKGHSRVKGGSPYLDESGAGIFFKESANIAMENIKVALSHGPNQYATTGECANKYCGPFPYAMVYAYNIYGQDSPSPKLTNVYTKDGSTGFWCKDCPDGVITHYKGENFHGPFPRGQCFQVVSSERFIVQDFTCVNDNEVAFNEDVASIWNSSNSIARRGVINGGNSPTGVGIISEMSSHILVEDIDVTQIGGVSFSAYGATNVTFLRTRAIRNHGDGGCLKLHGYCKDSTGNYPLSDLTSPASSSNYKQNGPDSCTESGDDFKRNDREGRVWYAGDYTADQAGGAYSYEASDIKILDGKWWEMYDKNDNADSCDLIKGGSSDEWWMINAATDRTRAWGTTTELGEENYTMAEFDLRIPFEPTFCWER